MAHEVLVFCELNPASARWRTVFVLSASKTVPSTPKYKNQYNHKDEKVVVLMLFPPTMLRRLTKIAFFNGEPDLGQLHCNVARRSPIVEAADNALTQRPIPISNVVSGFIGFPPDGMTICRAAHP